MSAAVIAVLVVSAALFALALFLFSAAAVFYARARIVLKSAVADKETTRILQDRALVAQRRALDLAASAEEYLV